MGQGALTLTPDGIVVYANSSFAELLGRPLGTVIGSRIEGTTGGPRVMPDRPFDYAAMQAAYRRAGGKGAWMAATRLGDTRRFRCPSWIPATLHLGRIVLFGA